MVESICLGNDTCSICHEDIRFDPLVHDVCELCGMSVRAPSRAPKFITTEGKTLFFCCKRCLSIYKKEIIDNMDIVKTLNEHKDASSLDEYDEIVRNMIAAYLNIKYPVQ